MADATTGVKTGQPDPDQPDHGYGEEHRRATPLHDWRLKAATQTLLGWLPASERLNYVFQRRVTRTLPISDAELVGQVEKARRNLDAFSRLHRIALGDAQVYEFGVGWDLLMPLLYYSAGVEQQTVVDLKPLARADLIRDIARRLGDASHVLGLRRRPVLPTGERSARELAASWGIDYRAPADARKLDLPSSSIDLITSCDVMEHVPLNDIGAILTECNRLLRDDGLLRIRIDYQDHYWYFDTRVSPYNFLRFDERAWKRFNPPLHYQNRLRHDAFVELISTAGLAVVEDDHHKPTAEDLRLLDSVPLAPPFRFEPAGRLAIRYANLSLMKRTQPLVEVAMGSADG